MLEYINIVDFKTKKNTHKDNASSSISILQERFS